MKRSAFLSGAALLTGGALLKGNVVAAAEISTSTITPPYLRPGDTIAITSPAGYINTEELQPAISVLKDWGFRVRLGDTVGRRDCSFGGTDEQRAMDLQILIDDPHVKAILSARGGYGVTRILDKLDLSRLRSRPKWMIGFSDITALHLHLDRKLSLASLHSKMCNSFPENWSLAEAVVQETISSIRDALTGKKMQYAAAPTFGNRIGKAVGTLVGGNLSVIQTCMGTASEIRTDHRILFLEEVGEYAYSIDRMLTNLRRAGKFNKLHGLIIGGFNRIKADDPGQEFGRTVQDMVLEKVADFNFPVCFNFPVGHQKNNFALKCGVEHTLEVTDSAVSLREN